MSNFQSFLLGIGVSFAVYYLNKKGQDGRSILDDMIDNPRQFVAEAKDQVIEEVVVKVKEQIS